MVIIRQGGRKGGGRWWFGEILRVVMGRVAKRGSLGSSAFRGGEIGKFVYLVVLGYGPFETGLCGVVILKCFKYRVPVIRISRILTLGTERSNSDIQTCGKQSIIHKVQRFHRNIMIQGKSERIYRYQYYELF